MPRWLDAGSDVPAAMREALRETAELGPDRTQLERLIAESARCAHLAVARRQSQLATTLAVLSLVFAAGAALASAGDSPPITPEVRLLLEARRALPHAPARAERLLRQHRQRFAGGDYIEEREAMQVETQARLGDRVRARENFGRFRHQFPESPYLERLADVLR